MLNTDIQLWNSCRPPKKGKAKAPPPAKPPVELPPSQAETFSFSLTPRPFKNAEYLASKTAIQRKAKAVKIMLLAERDKELAEVARMKKKKRQEAKAKAAALAADAGAGGSGKVGGDAMDIDAKPIPKQEVGELAEEEVEALICYSSIEAPPSLIPPKRYCDITGLEASYTDPQTGLRYHDRNIFAHIRTLKPAAVQSYLALRGGGQPVIV
ncbi:chromatin-remodeling complex subunit ies6 [Tulasnella sp. 403]|nr:chromatin-remodeling complex subunit ies6 [Tulasnella sp. 403]